MADQIHRQPIHPVAAIARICTSIVSIGHQLASVKETRVICCQTAPRAAMHATVVVAQSVSTTMITVHTGRRLASVNRIQPICYNTVNLVVVFRIVKNVSN